jgi:hypothetical protein
VVKIDPTRSVMDLEANALKMYPSSITFSISSVVFKLDSYRTPHLVEHIPLFLQQLTSLFVSFCLLGNVLDDLPHPD